MFQSRQNNKATACLHPQAPAAFSFSGGTNQPGTVLNLTRSIRRQIYTADLIYAMSVCLAGTLPKKTKDVLTRIQARLNNINKLLYGGGRFVLSERDYKKYNRIINQVKDIISDISTNEKLNPDFFNACMMLVEDTYESAKQSKRTGLLHEWAMLRRSMSTFCSHVLDEPDEFDPDWAGYKYEPMGIALAAKLNAVMMS